jgi:photosystem II stability/assembly factor-like uncharacterized protein
VRSAKPETLLIDNIRNTGIISVNMENTSNDKFISKILLLILLLMPVSSLFAWYTTGMGGGGAQYGPSISPQDPNLRFVGSDMSGWYRSTDGGNTWNTLDFYQISTDVDYGYNNGIMCSMAFDPANPTVVYGYGRQQDSQNNPSNLLVSNDGGVTWSALSASPAWGTNRVTVIYIDRGNTDFMLVGTESGVYASTNKGLNFTGPSGSSGYVTGIMVDQASPAGNRTCYAGSWNGIWKSTNNAGSWAAANTGLPSANSTWFCGASTAAGSRLYDIDGSNNSIYTSVDASAWAQSSAADAFYEVACADSDTAAAYAVNGNDRTIWKTADGGGAWARVFIDSNPVANASLGWIDYDLGFSWGGPNYDIKTSASDPGHVMVTNMGETFASDDAGATWQEVYSIFSDTAPRAAGKKWASRGLEMTSAWHYDIDPNNPAYHYICYTDIGFARSTDAGATWYDTARKGTASQNWTNTFYQIAFNPTPGVILAAVSGLHDLDHSSPLGRTGQGGVVKSANYGVTWAPSSTGLPVSPTTSIVFDPVNNVYFAAVWGWGVYKSTDATGSNWSATTAVAIGNNRHVYSLKLAGGALYCLLSGQPGYANAGGIFKSTNQGGTWTNIAVSVDSGGNPLYYPMEFDINPDDPNIIFLVGQDNQKGGYQGGCYRTINGGASWTLMNMPVGATPYGYAPSIDPGNTNTVYFGTENQGYFKTTDGGSTWARETGVPFSSIQRLTFAPNAVYVCTFGGGVWVQPSGAPVPTPSQTTQAASPTFTPAASHTDTPSFTVTRTSTQTFTLTETGTDTPNYSPTMTPTITETITGTPPTITVSPSFTGTPAATFTFTAQAPGITPTITPTTGISIGNEFAVGDPMLYPNPYNPDKGDLNIRIRVSGYAKTISVRIYTMAFRRIIETTTAQTGTGDVTAVIPAASGMLSKLASGLYYLIVRGTDTSGKEAESKPVEMIILK